MFIIISNVIDTVIVHFKKLENASIIWSAFFIFQILNRVYGNQPYTHSLTKKFILILGFNFLCVCGVFKTLNPFNTYCTSYKVLRIYLVIGNTKNHQEELLVLILAYNIYIILLEWIDLVQRRKYSRLNLKPNNHNLPFRLQHR